MLNNNYDYFFKDVSETQPCKSIKFLLCNKISLITFLKIIIIILFEIIFTRPEIFKPFKLYPKNILPLLCQKKKFLLSGNSLNINIKTKM